MRSKIFLCFVIFLTLFFLSGCTKIEKKKNMENSTDKKAVIVIADEGFQDFEYSETRAVLEKAGIIITTADLKGDQAISKSGDTIKVDKKIEDIEIKDFDALIFIGGPGALEYVENKNVQQLVQQAISENKILGAICIAPEILAKAGVLSGKKATVWTDEFDKTSIDVLRANAAEYINQAVVADGRIITANGPSASSEFGQKIVELLNQ
ncbi:MAG: DJ-1/PfpI family protein [Patescibacteria group bacterium]|nr:DJ-1/PfpI family protein [Patescibacteria group bacterium]MDD5534645.1 DJ-1/PfpI family protein [Patescibacteria group bacterium]